MTSNGAAASQSRMNYSYLSFVSLFAFSVTTACAIDFDTDGAAVEGTAEEETSTISSELGAPTNVTVKSLSAEVKAILKVTQSDITAGRTATAFDFNGDRKPDYVRISADATMQSARLRIALSSANGRYIVKESGGFNPGQYFLDEWALNFKIMNNGVLRVTNRQASPHLDSTQGNRYDFLFTGGDLRLIEYASASSFRNPANNQVSSSSEIFNLSTGQALAGQGRCDSLAYPTGCQITKRLGLTQRPVVTIGQLNKPPHNGNNYVLSSASESNAFYFRPLLPAGARL